MADPALQHRLSRIALPEAFEAAAIAAAQALGIALDRSAIAAAGRPDPLAIDRYGGAPPWATGWPGPGWRPVGVVATAAGPAVDWAHFGDERLTAPFYGRTALAARALPFNRMMRLRTTLASLVATAPEAVRPPDGLIYHLSRCGSTLIAQMLSAIAGVTILSEPSPFDDVVRIACTDPALVEADRVALVRAMAGALGPQPDAATSGPYVIKLDCWHSRALPLLRRAFPDTPYVFAYRDPVEIMASHRSQPGMQMVPGVLPATIFGIARAAVMSLDDYGALVLDRICRDMLDDGGDALLVNYVELPGAVEAVILPHLSIVPTATDRAAMAAAGARNAKAPDQRFTPDTAAKQARADESLRNAAAPVQATYQRLETRRLEQRAAAALHADGVGADSS